MIKINRYLIIPLLWKKKHSFKKKLNTLKIQKFFSKYLKVRKFKILSTKPSKTSKRHKIHFVAKKHSNSRMTATHVHTLNYHNIVLWIVLSYESFFYISFIYWQQIPYVSKNSPRSRNSRSIQLSATQFHSLWSRKTLETSLVSLTLCIYTTSSFEYSHICIYVGPLLSAASLITNDQQTLAWRSFFIYPFSFAQWTNVILFLVTSRLDSVFSYGSYSTLLNKFIFGSYVFNIAKVLTK